MSPCTPPCNLPCRSPCSSPCKYQVRGVLTFLRAPFRGVDVPVTGAPGRVVHRAVALDTQAVGPGCVRMPRPGRGRPAPWGHGDTRPTRRGPLRGGFERCQRIECLLGFARERGVEQVTTGRGEQPEQSAQLVPPTARRR